VVEEKMKTKTYGTEDDESENET